MREEGDVPGGLCGSGRPAALGGHHDEDGDCDDDHDGPAALGGHHDDQDGDNKNVALMMIQQMMTVNYNSAQGRLQPLLGKGCVNLAKSGSSPSRSKFGFLRESSLDFCVEQICF